MLLKSDERPRPPEILQVEDTPTDALLTADAFRTCGIPVSIHVVTDGSQAVAYLRHREAFAEAPRPDLVILDFTLPILDGPEVLRFIEQDPELKTIPVVVFTSMDSEESRQLAYELSANSYIVKPADAVTFREKIQSMATYWLRTASRAVPA